MGNRAAVLLPSTALGAMPPLWARFQRTSRAVALEFDLAEVLEHPGRAEAAQVIDAPPLEAPQGPSSSRTPISTTLK